MYVQYPGCRAAILGVIHHHRSDASFNFTPEIYSRIESQSALLPWVCVALMIQINEHTMVFRPSPLHHQCCASSYRQRSRRARPVRKYLRVQWRVSATQSSWLRNSYHPETTKHDMQSDVHMTDVNMCVRQMCIIWNWTLLLINYDNQNLVELNSTYIFCYSFCVLSYDHVVKSRRVRQNIFHE
jgi:hypothetical protein